MGNKQVIEHELNLIEDIKSYPTIEKQLNQSNQFKKSTKPDSRLNTEINGSETKKGKLFFVKKKRRNKLDKSEQNLNRSSELIKNQSEFSLSIKNAQVQAGNGLVSLKNLNSYLESDDRFHLVNRIIKRIGVFNRQTQTDFEYSFNKECMKIVEVSARLTEQLENLNTERLTIEELEEEQHQTHYEGFNMIYTGRSNLKQNKRNVCIQKCINKATVGTQTIQSRSHLIIIEILNRLNKIDKLKELNELKVLTKVGESIQNNSKDNNFDRLSDELDLKNLEYLENESKNLKQLKLKRKSDTYLNNNYSKLDDLHQTSITWTRRVHSQPVLKDLNMNELDLNNCKKNDGFNSDSLESIDKDKLEEYLKNLLLQVHLSQENQKKGKNSYNHNYMYQVANIMYWQDST